MTGKLWHRTIIAASLLGLLLLQVRLGWTQALTGEERMKRDITFLASDECEGRGPGTKGIDKAAVYIAGQFTQAGLKPGGVKGSFFQPFTIANPSILASRQQAQVAGARWPGDRPRTR